MPTLVGAVRRSRNRKRYRRAEQRSAPTKMPPARAAFSFRPMAGPAQAITR